VWKNDRRILFQLRSLVHHPDHICAYAVHVLLGIACASEGDDKHLERDQR
jgi:hypothetical protein